MKKNTYTTPIQTRPDKNAAAARQARLQWASAQEAAALLAHYGTPAAGLSPAQAARSRESHGANILPCGKKHVLAKRLCAAFLNPFTIVLLALAGISLVTDVVLAPPGEANCATLAIITGMVLLSGLLRLVQETRSSQAARRLAAMLTTTACVQREGCKGELPMEELVVGDLVHLSAGDMIPADLRILQAKDLFLSQSALTGESEPVEKTGGSCPDPDGAITDRPNLAFWGSSVVSGTATGVVLAVGGQTVLGGMAKELDRTPPKTSFEKGVNAVSWVLIRFMLIMVPVVLFLNGLTKGDWMQALLFALSVAVGLTPEMLPMIVTTSLARGAMVMSRQKVIVKNLNAMQDLGAMDILCTDKTGTLTQDKVVLEYHLNIDGKEDVRVLRHGFLNSYFQTGLKNLIDLSVIAKQEALGAQALKETYVKVDEIPFDFQRRRMSVVVQDRTGKTQLVTKGAVEEMLLCCAYAECGGQVRPLTDEVVRLVLDQAARLNQQGMRVIAVAQKTDPAPVGQFSAADESEMVLLGFLAFLDPPKESTKEALEALAAHGVAVKILTGDNHRVTQAICRQVGLPAEPLLLGSDLDRMDDETLGRAAEETTVFAKLSPAQKARVVRVLRARGHRVGHLGDGINDAAAMQAADVGISVDTAVDIAKETSDVVLLEKDLSVLRRGVREGRRTYANMIKYIKITASSNFGNMLSVLAASAFLPFLPMAALHLVLLNLIYDVSCTAMSWDTVDPEALTAPRQWQAGGIPPFMVWFGPVSSLFDIAAFLLLYFVLCPLSTGGLLFSQLTDPGLQALYIALFQTGWFVASMWTQTLVLHTLRTPRLPFLQSRAAWPVTVLTGLGIALVTALPYTPLGAALALAPLPPVYFLGLALLVAGYLALTTAAKRRWLRRYHSLL